MKLIINNVEHDSTKELELFKPNFGFKCTINSGESIVYNNVTEFHHLYSLTRSAFESVIHKNGRCLKLRKIDSIIIEDAVDIEEDF